MSGLEAIKARAAAYAEYGTPGLRAPEDRAELLAIMNWPPVITGDAIEAAARVLHDLQENPAQPIGISRAELTAALEAAAPHMSQTPYDFCGGGETTATIAELRLFNHHDAADLIERMATP